MYKSILTWKRENNKSWSLNIEFKNWKFSETKFWSTGDALKFLICELPCQVRRYFTFYKKKSEVSQVRQFGAIKSVGSKQHRWLHCRLPHSVDFIAFCTFQQFKYLPSLINCTTYWFIWKEMSRTNLDFFAFKNFQEMFLSSHW